MTLKVIKLTLMAENTPVGLRSLMNGFAVSLQEFNPSKKWPRNIIQCQAA